MLGKIRWFDELRGEGQIRLDSGESVFIHFTELVDRELLNGNYHYPNKFVSMILEDNFVAGTSMQYIEGIGWRDLYYKPCDPRDSD